MWKFLVIGGATAATLFAQGAPSQMEIANLREDVRGLTQRVGDLSLRIEQLERENNELRSRVGAAGQNYATVAQLNDAVEDLNRTIRSAVATSKNETLQHVAAQMEKLGRQTNAALDSLAKTQATRPAMQTTFAEDYAKEGMSYTVQKGDSLAGIAKKTGARFQDIINANKISDPSRITVGQVLFIPNPPSGAAK
ncbi:LysM peptidoglycan-binding domain-containing protein [Opitutus sp. ER46]|uniref:LysM peptidoglycan-binding domain-containing protein n=1 Tax=Opitutus sp. ER46 TaxID=2161864 RepID=UPI000D31F34A|nr:LysM peptidoglycan-binding domain-containing protein [Opitutus sp. ER46]PTX94229.1 peptidoglycan-binding protein [Opitutus sp. ER46]